MILSKTIMILVIFLKLSGPAELSRMQFIFLYYDQNRNGRLEVEEVATMIEHIQQLHGESCSSAMVKSSAGQRIGSLLRLGALDGWNMMEWCKKCWKYIVH